MDEIVEKNDSVKTLNQKAIKFHLNKPVNCPWTSRAPITSSNNKSGANCIENHRRLPDGYCSKEHCDDTANEGVTVKSGENGHQTTSTQFFHFLRLMQLFPDVHPATLHTVMALCNNDFFTTVDKLLYAKRCKDLIVKRRQFPLVNNRAKIRYQPYCYASNCNDNKIKVVLNSDQGETRGSDQSTSNQQPAIICDAIFPCVSMDSKKLIYKNRIKTEVLNIDSDIAAVASPHCELPIKPLSPSPDIAQDLTRQANRKSID